MSTARSVSGVSESDASVAMRSPTATPRCSASEPTRRTTPSSMPPEPVDRVVLLAPARHRLGGRAAPTPSGLPPEASSIWRKFRGVDVQRLHIDDDLGLEAARGVGVQPLCRLRHGPRWVEHAVRAQRIACGEGGRVVLRSSRRGPFSTCRARKQGQ